MQTIKTALVGALALASFGAVAADATDTFAVTATVQDSCLVSAGDLAFPAVNSLSVNDTDATSDISVTCSATTGYNVKLSAGDGAGATDTARKMTITGGGTETLNYALYSDDTYATNWDSLTGIPGTGTGSAITHTVYGRVPTGQTGAKVGDYTDTITVTVTY